MLVLLLIGVAPVHVYELFGVPVLPARPHPLHRRVRPFLEIVFDAIGV